MLRLDKVRKSKKVDAVFPFPVSSAASLITGQIFLSIRGVFW